MVVLCAGAVKQSGFVRCLQQSEATFKGGFVAGCPGYHST